MPPGTGICMTRMYLCPLLLLGRGPTMSMPAMREKGSDMIGSACMGRVEQAVLFSCRPSDTLHSFDRSWPRLYKCLASRTAATTAGYSSSFTQVSCHWNFVSQLQYTVSWHFLEGPTGSSSPMLPPFLTALVPDK